MPSSGCSLAAVWFCCGWVGVFCASLCLRPGVDEASVGGGFFTLFALTLANPATILSFVAIFASLGPLTAGDDWLGAAVMTLGVFLGSLLWWIVLVGGVSLMRKRLSARVMRWLNLGSGCLIMVFGMVALVVGIDTWT